MRYRVHDIEWDGPGAGLPEEMSIELPRDHDPDEDLAEAISARTGRCTKGFLYEAEA